MYIKCTIDLIIMFYKNCQALAFTKPFQHGVEELNKYLAEEKFTALEELQLSNIGWVNPFLFSNEDIFAVSADGFIHLKLHQETKELKKSTITKKVAKRVDKVEKETGKPVSRQDKAIFEDEIINELLPYAQTTDKTIMGLICPKENLLLINSSTTKEAETFCGLLRKSLGSLPITRVMPGGASNGHYTPEYLFTQWIINEIPVPPSLALGLDCVLVSTEAGDKSKITIKEQTLQTQEIAGLIHADKEAKELRLRSIDQKLIKKALEGDEKDQLDATQFETLCAEGHFDILSFTLNNDLIFKTIKYNDFNIINDESGMGDLRTNIYYGASALIDIIKEIFELFKSNAACHLDDPNDLITLAKPIDNFDDITASQDNDEPEDELYPEVFAYCVELGRASTTAIQRKFKLGYNRSARLVELIKPKLAC